MTKRHLTPEQDLEIARLYAEGSTMQAIADLFGVSRTPMVMDSLARTGTPSRGPGNGHARRAFTAEQDAEIARRYLAGETLPALAESFDVSYGPITTALDRQGVARRSIGDYGWQDTPEARAEILRLFDEGLGVKKIARRVGTGDVRVSAVIKDSGRTVRLGGSHYRFDDEQADALIREYEEGVSLSSLALKYGSNVTTVRQTLQRRGVETVAAKRKAFWTPERERWLCEEFASGRSQADLARDAGCSQGAISGRLRALGILSPIHARGVEHAAWTGGRIVTVGGYIWAYVHPEDEHLVTKKISGSYVPEHRLVMARFLGRPLRREESVHHIDRNPSNNDLGNLQLRQGSHGKGAVFECGACGSKDIRAVPLKEPV